MKTHVFHYRSLLKEELQTVQALMLETLHVFPQDVAEVLSFIISNGGKRLRPAMVLLSATLHGADIQKAVPVAAAVELLHTATLVHDDLIDNALIRRGAQTLNARWTPATTVLAGDVAFAWAAKFATQGENIRLMRRFSETLATICQGELNQMFKGRGNIPTEIDYYERIFAKTASLFALTTEVGAILANASGEVVHQAWRFGKLLGEAFQIVDDILDFTSDEATLGKPIASDLRQGLITLPVLYYCKAHPDDDCLQVILERRADDAAIHAIVNDLLRSDAADQAMAQADARIVDALAILAKYPDTPHRGAMEEIARFAIQRCY